MGRARREAGEIREEVLISELSVKSSVLKCC